MTKPLRYICYTVPAVVIAIALCYLWADRPIAVAVLSLGLVRPNTFLSFDYTMLVTQLVYCVMLPLFVLYFWLRSQTFSARWLRCVELLCIAVPVTFFIKTCFQFIFGRFSPRYRDSTVLLFVRNHHLYGFHWLMGGGCFPSGHMAMLSAGLVSITLFYRKMLLPTIILLLLMAAALLVLDYHFLSDVIAGTYLGTSIALAIWWLAYRQYRGGVNG